MRGKRVLIVEDDMRSAYSLSAALDSVGIATEIATDAPKAMARLEREPLPDALVVDWMLANASGLDLLRRVRATPRLARIPTLMVSAHAGATEREQALAAGALDLLPKPVDLDRLLSILESSVGIPA